MKKIFTCIVFIGLFNFCVQSQITSSSPYCTPSLSIIGCNQPGPPNTPGNFTNDFIQSFYTTGAIQNISNINSYGNCMTNSYLYYCQHYLVVAPGSVITCSLLSGTLFAQGFAIFIDWNQDGVFNTPSEQVAATPGVPTAGTWTNLTFTVPPAQPSGTYRIRVRCVRNTNGVSIDPCSSYTTGETEDYNLYIGNTPPSQFFYSASTNSLCIGGSATLTAGGATSYSWSTGASTSSIVVSPTINTNYTLSALSGTCPIAQSSFILVKPTPTVTATSNQSVICSGSSVTLTATGASTYSWMPSGVSGSVIVVSPTVSVTYTTVGTATNGCNAAAMVTQSVMICAGINSSLTDELLMVVYPNPFKEELVVKFSEETELRLYNSLGKLILQKTISAEEALNTESIPLGIYFLSVDSRNLKKVIKLIRI